MSCRFCAHWRRPEKMEWRSKKAQLGECTLNPVWIETSDRHFCSRFFQETSAAPDSTMTHDNNAMMHHYFDATVHERKQRIALQKQVKELRAQIRALKGSKSNEPIQHFEEEEKI